MHFCANLPAFKNGSQVCNMTVEQKNYPQYRYNESYCINWHLYYTMCSDRNENPFQDTISFDNIGLAWIAIFLVSNNYEVELFLSQFKNFNHIKHTVSLLFKKTNQIFLLADVIIVLITFNVIQFDTCWSIIHILWCIIKLNIECVVIVTMS